MFPLGRLVPFTRETDHRNGCSARAAPSGSATPMTPAVLSASFDREVDYSPSVEPERKEGIKFESVKSETKAEERSEDELKVRWFCNRQHR